MTVDAASPVGDDGIAATAEAGAVAAGAGSPDVFISYSREDEAFARRLSAALEARGKDVWVDWEDIPRTADWRARIHRGIEASQTFVAVLSPELVESEVCCEELSHATASNKRIVPVLRREVDRGTAPDGLLAPNWIFFRDGDDFEASVAELVEALETDLGWLEAHARLLVRASEWEREGRDASFLLRGRDLKDAEAWLAEQGSHREAATSLQAAYIVASRKGAARRQRIVFGAVVLALVVATVLGVVALIQRNDAIAQSHVSRSRELAASAIAQLASDPELSLLLARDAVDVRPTPQAEDALRRSLRESHLRLTLGEGRGRVTSAHFSPDARRIVTAAGRTATIWDARSGEVLRLLRGHRGRITDASFSPDGTRVVTASADRTARVWDSATGKAVAVLGGHRSSVTEAAFSPDGRRVVTTSDDRRAALWDTGTGRRIAFLPSGLEPIDAVFSRDGSRVVTTDHDGYLRIWNGRTGKLLLVVRANDQGEPTFSPTLGPRGKLVVAANWDFAGVWNAHTGKLVKVLAAHQLDPLEFTFTSVSFSRDGKYLVSSGVDSTARVWDTRTWNQIAVLHGHSGIVEDARFSPDGSRAVTVGDDGTARVWDTITGDVLAVLAVPGGTVLSAEFARDGNRIVTATDDGTRVWEASGFRPIRRITLPHDAPRSYHVYFEDARFSPNSRVVATVSTWPPIYLWQATSGKRLARLPGRGPRLRTSLAFSPDSKRIVTTSDKSVTIWSASTGARLVRWRASVRTAAFSSDGRHVLTTGSGGNARVWNAATGRQFRVLHVAQHNDYVRANMAFSPDATLVAGHTEHGVAVWDVATGRRRAVLRGTLGELGGAPAFSADDRYVYADTDDGAVGSGGVTRAGVWDAATGARIAAFRAGPALGDGVFSNDGRLVLTRGADAVEVWNARTGEPLAIMRGHGKANVDSVESASFSPDGRFVITSGTDGTAKIWDPETGERVGTLRAATQTSQTSAPAARFSPDGRRIVFVSGTFALLYECEECGTLAELRRLAEARISRTITDREHKRYLRATVGG